MCSCLPETASAIWHAGLHESQGNCWDNAPMESFWGALKTELVHHQRFSTREEAQREIIEYIEIFYNRIRKQARLGYLSPAAFNQKYYAAKIAA